LIAVTFIINMLLLVSDETILVAFVTNYNQGMFMATIDNGTLSLQNFLPYRLSALSNRISQSLALKYNKRFGITVQEWRVLAALGEETNLSAVTITNRIAMDKVAVSRAVKKLIDKGLVIKQRVVSDNRSHRLTLTDSGSKMYQQLIPIAIEHEQQAIENLSKDERSQLLLLLDKLDKVQLKLNQ